MSIGRGKGAPSLLSDNAMAVFTTAACVLMAFAPILDPYVVSIASYDVRLIDVMVGVFVVSLFLFKKCSWTKKGLSLLGVAGVFLVCTLISAMSFVIGRNVIVAIRISVVYLTYSAFYGAMSGHIVLDRFAKYATYIAIVATALLFFQYATAGHFWDGKLPLPLSESDVFMPLIDPTTGNVRPHGFFQEVSYYAMYVSPILIFSLIKERYIIALFLATGLLLSSSLLGFVSLALALLVVIVKSRDSSGHIDWGKATVAIAALFMFGLACFFLLESGAVPVFNSIADEIARRISSILDINATYSWGRSSAQLRLLGNIGLFEHYDYFQRLFGLGVGQYANVFSGVETTYSSSLVNMLLSYGYVGITALVVWLIYIIKSSRPSMRFFPPLVVLALLTDNVLFGWYFFYLLSWVVDDSAAVS